MDRIENKEIREDTHIQQNGDINLIAKIRVDTQVDRQTARRYKKPPFIFSKQGKSAKNKPVLRKFYLYDYIPCCKFLGF
jgi:hypothetical protein